MQIQELSRIIDLVVRRLNAYVGKERIHCFSVVRPVAMTQMLLSRWSMATEIKTNSSLLVIKLSSCVFLILSWKLRVLSGFGLKLDTIDWNSACGSHRIVGWAKRNLISV